MFDELAGERKWEGGGFTCEISALSLCSPCRAQQLFIAEKFRHA
jgi:hypothetical protein